MKNIAMILLSICIGFIELSDANAEVVGSGSSSWTELKGDFGNAIKLNVTIPKSIEYCPDNTCDRFVAKNVVAEKNLGDFVYLYLYFFSDYYVLKDWRASEKSSATVRGLLNDPQYAKCLSKVDGDSARCILRGLSVGNKIQLYNVRHDEGKIHKTRISITKTISSLRGQALPLA